jgi:Pyridoxamine 5'-phosphate oxidase
LIEFDLLLDRRRARRHRRRMPSWSEFEAAAPEIAARVRGLLDAHVHKTIATVRRDGSPRVSGTETNLRDGELWIGSMWDALKARDLRRDPRFALHSGSDDPPGWEGDAKLAGVAEEIADEARVREVNGEEVGRSHLFRLDLREVSTVALNTERNGLVIDVWTPEGGVRTIRRK